MSLENFKVLIILF